MKTISLLPAVLLGLTGLAHPGHDPRAGRGDDPGHVFLTAAPPLGAEPANRVVIAEEGGFRVITSNGWPDHKPGEFPRRGNPNVPTPQEHRFRVTLKPKALPEPVRGHGGWWGVALNGVPFEPGTGETWNNDPRSGWRYEAATGFLNLGLDEHNAHVQPTGAYHYHALPVGLVQRLGGDTNRMCQIAWAADGFPVYTGRAHAAAGDAASPLRAMKPSYRLKPGPRPVQPGGPAGDHDGRFTQDFEYVAGLGDLDECNGRTGVTPEFPQGTYYYCVTPEFPFVPRLWRGEPDPSFQKAGPPPGGGEPGRGPRPAPLGGPPRGILEGGPGPAAHPGGPGPVGDAPPPGGPGGPGGPAGRGGPPPLVQALDSNADGVIDAGEIERAPAALRSLDKNGDGILQPEEYRPPFPGGPGLGGARGEGRSRER